MMKHAEPTAGGPRNHCSATELRWLGLIISHRSPPARPLRSKKPMGDSGKPNCRPVLCLKLLIKPTVEGFSDLYCLPPPPFPEQHRGVLVAARDKIVQQLDAALRPVLSV